MASYNKTTETTQEKKITVALAGPPNVGPKYSF